MVLGHSCGMKYTEMQYLGGIGGAGGVGQKLGGRGGVGEGPSFTINTQYTVLGSSLPCAFMANNLCPKY